MSLDYQRVRRYVHNSSSFKQKNAKLDLRLKAKSKKASRDVGVESPEFQLLVRLYVPSNLLITNNKVDLKELMQYLPVIVNDTLPELNFEIHIFLSCIVSKFVLSWYELKLNTNDPAFIDSVYSVLCDFVREFSARVLRVVEGPLLLHAINDAGNIISEHLQDIRVKNGHPQFYHDHIEKAQALVSADNYQSIEQQYLAAKHVVFESYKSESDTTSNNTSLYSRILFKNILRITFEKDRALDLSPIATEFVGVLLADLVLKKIIVLLLKPEFILTKVIAKSVNVLDGNANRGNRGPEKLPLMYKLELSVLKALAILQCLIGFLREKALNSSFPSMESYFLIPLLDSIFNLRQRRPIALNFGAVITAVFCYIFGLKEKLEFALGSLLLRKIWQSSVLEDSSLAGHVKNLRGSIFERAQEPKIELKTPGDELLEKVRDDVLSMYRRKIDTNLLFGAFCKWVSEDNMSESELSEAIENFLSSFNNFTVEDFHETSELNKLLVITLLDCIVKYLYPEMVQ